MNLYSLCLLFLLGCCKTIFCSEEDKCYHKNCDECISFDKDCVWCAESGYEGSRCRSISSGIQKGWCKDESLINPKSKTVVTMNKPFEDSKAGAAVQFRPQNITVQARPGDTIDFKMQYKPASDYPLDVYFLMDISHTMRDKINELRKQATNIYEYLIRYTNNVRFGLGSFVDKPGFPYFDPNKHIGHAFKNHVALTKDIREFQSAIPQSNETGSNFDDPESGLDGLMQVMTCHEEIKWRIDARRFIILFTDSTYHSAGDGKMIGIIEPNDMQCHYKNNVFETQMLLDYPSVSQINKVATENNFKIIFAAKNQQGDEKDTVKQEPIKDVYIKLAQKINNAEYAQLDAKGDTILNMIKNSYATASRTGELEIRKYDFVEVITDQVCPSKNCEITHAEPVLNIKGKLKVLSCPIGGAKQEILIKTKGLTDKLTINLEVICNCNCHDDKTVSAHCHNAGVIDCGICKCNPGIHGAHCNCTGSSTTIEDFNKCRFPKTKTICNGHGTCSCGECSCGHPFSGTFCEFNNEACPKVKGVLCAGHGSCKQEKCECHGDWSGNDCACSRDVKTCKAPYSNEVCSGNGACVCGKCNCFQNVNQTYWGEFCDGCEECSKRRCKELEEFVLCVHEHNQTFCEPQFKAKNGETNDVSVVIVNQTIFDGPTFYMAKRCSAVRKDGSSIAFKYFYKGGRLALAIKDEPEAKETVNLLIVVSSAAGIVLLIGIATVIAWKVLMDLHDKREYEKFAADSQAAGFDVSLNPLFVPPAINFTNPAFEPNA